MICYFRRLNWPSGSISPVQDLQPADLLNGASFISQRQIPTCYPASRNNSKHLQLIYSYTSGRNLHLPVSAALQPPPGVMTQLK